MTPDNPQPKTSIATSILDRIAGEQITPTPRYAFLLREGFMMFLVLATVVLGTFSVAVMIFILISANYALYEATHSNFTTFLFDVLPALWGGSFIALTTLLYTQLRHVKHGYRYSVTRIIGGSIILSCLGGLLLYGLGFGYALDQFLGKQITMYMSMEKLELKMWQMPEAGRLVGTVVTVYETDTTGEPDKDVVTFTDSTGVAWTLDTSELNEREEGYLKSGRQLRLLGTSTAPGLFHACGVFAWMFGDDWGKGRHEMEEERSQFESKMKFNQEKLRAGTAMMVPPSDNSMICAHLDMMRAR